MTDVEYVLALLDRIEKLERVRFPARKLWRPVGRFEAVSIREELREALDAYESPPEPDKPQCTCRSCRTKRAE